MLGCTDHLVEFLQVLRVVFRQRCRHPPREVGGDWKNIVDVRDYFCIDFLRVTADQILTRDEDFTIVVSKIGEPTAESKP